MRLTSYIASALFGMATVVCAMPTGLSGADWESVLAARGAENIPTAYARDYDHDVQLIEKRKDQLSRVTIIDRTGKGRSRGGKMRQAEQDIWNVAAQKAASAQGANSVTIVHRPHDGGETGSQDMAEHITVKFPGKTGLVHVYADGTFSSEANAARGRSRQGMSAPGSLAGSPAGSPPGSPTRRPSASAPGSLSASPAGSPPGSPSRSSAGSTGGWPYGSSPPTGRRVIPDEEMF
ncbi:uncharacterized protein PgNI_07820 [Pyricularia grisea]|uniref:Uncharacterized protein n=1 Tax=Pyricularia grisea TaxID=148305 RepID=A0A6P8B055_PYRGI|nr:uncharacterized protein PgNI_07820 [Pyricularia grisea]TLD08295.1 hypothetical protein PgNI_07820 [Pyricularia grisea]